MNFQENYSLSKLTTFRIGGEALYFVEVGNENELMQALDFAKGRNLPILIIGGGSNLLVSDQGFKGLVIKIGIRGMEIVNETSEEVVLKVGAGEVWDSVVAFAVSKNLWGIENLSNIPGLTGAIPVQNVGAYGQEASQVVTNVEVLDLEKLELKNFSNQECNFAYRQSNFNTIWKGKFAILSVTFKLSKTPSPNLSYVDVKNYFLAHNEIEPNLTSIRAAIIEIRKNKFPDLSQYGTAGSFFKNLILSEDQYMVLEQKIKENFGTEAYDKLTLIKDKFPQAGGIKIPTAFLLDLCGLKGKSVGETKLWEKQPLAIVNVGNAKASDVVELFQQVRDEIKVKTGMDLQPEPEFIGF